MVQGSLLTDEIRAQIGKETARSIPFEMEKGAIRKCADAVGDRNLVYYDEEYARKTRFGGIIAPLGFLSYAYDPLPGTEVPPPPEAPDDGISRRGHPQQTRIFIPDAPVIVAGGEEWEFIKPVRPGDVLRSVSRVKDIYEREGRSGRLVITITETTHYNQNDEVVAISRGTGISQPRGAQRR